MKIYVNGQWTIAEGFWWIDPQEAFLDREKAGKDYLELKVEDKTMVKYRLYFNNNSAEFNEIIDNCDEEQFDEECLLVEKWRNILGTSNFRIEIIDKN
jgi:hypothetical protein